MNLRRGSSAAVLVTAMVAGLLGCGGADPDASPTTLEGGGERSSPPPAGDAPDVVTLQSSQLGRPVHVWFRLRRDGAAERVDFDPVRRVVVAWRHGTVAGATATEVFDAIERLRFGDLQDSYDPGGPNGIIYEGDSLTVTVRAGEQTKSVLARPPKFVPPGLAQIADRLLEIGVELPPQPPRRSYLRAQQVTATRARDILAAGTFKPTTLASRDAAAPPTLVTALDAPGDLVPTDDTFDPARLGYDAPYGYFYVVLAGTMYEVAHYRGA